MAVKQAGFTIVEISLFMAITGLLFLIAVLGTGSTIRSVRFTDSARSLEAYIQKQYDEIVNGNNNRSSQISCNSGTISTTSAQTPGTSNCFLIGKLIVFTQGSSNVSVYNVIGTEPANVNYSQSDDQLIISYQPQVVTTSSVDTFSIPWGATATGFKRLSDSKATNALLLIRSPKSTRIISYTFTLSGSVPSDLSSVVGTDANRAQATNFCITSADGFGNPARLYISGGASQTAASVIFEAGLGDCNGS